MHEAGEDAAEHAHAHAPGGAEWPVRLAGVGRAALLLGFGVYFCAIYATDSVRNYINPEFNWLVLVSGGLFLLLGLAALAQWLRPRRDAHVHEPVRWGALLVVAL